MIIALNLDPKMTDDELKTFFSKFGPVTYAKIVITVDHVLQIQHSHGFVICDNKKSCQNVLSLKNPLQLSNRTIHTFEALRIFYNIETFRFGLPRFLWPTYRNSRFRRRI